MGQCLAQQVLQLVWALQACEKRPWHCCPWTAVAFSAWETSQLTSRKIPRTGPAGTAVKLESGVGGASGFSLPPSHLSSHPAILLPLP